MWGSGIDCKGLGCVYSEGGRSKSLLGGGDSGHGRLFLISIENNCLLNGRWLFLNLHGSTDREGTFAIPGCWLNHTPMGRPHKDSNVLNSSEILWLRAKERKFIAYSLPMPTIWYSEFYEVSGWSGSLPSSRSMTVQPWTFSSIGFTSPGLGEIYFDSDLFSEFM